MSKIYEALENAEKERLRKGSSVFPGPKVEEKPELSLGPKEEKKTVMVSGSKEEKMGRPEENAEKQRATELRKGSTPAPELKKEEKKTAPVLEPKSERMEKPAPFPAQEPREVRKTPLAVGPKRERVETHEENAEKQRATELTKGSSPVPEPNRERIERPNIVHPPVRPERPGSGRPLVSPRIRPERPESDRSLVSLFQPGSLGAEQFRKLRTQVLRLNISDGPRTIMVTSATAGEGKTFVAANLAAGIAHDLHFHALLVDCDLRSPSLSRWFGVQNGHGLSDYLVGRRQLPELLMKTEMEKLRILTGGSAQQKPVELIGSKRMEALVRELKSRYNDRYIIFDATPLLATSEPEVLARLVDGILIVVRAGVTPRETVKQAIASLDPKKILGFVLNDVEFKSSGLFSRYFGSDGYYTKYGYGKREAEPRGHSGGVSPLKKKSG